MGPRLWGAFTLANHFSKCGCDEEKWFDRPWSVLRVSVYSELAVSPIASFDQRNPAMQQSVQEKREESTAGSSLFWWTSLTRRVLLQKLRYTQLPPKCLNLWKSRRQTLPQPNGWLAIYNFGSFTSWRANCRTHLSALQMLKGAFLGCYKKQPNELLKTKRSYAWCLNIYIRSTWILTDRRIIWKYHERTLIDSSKNPPTLKYHTVLITRVRWWKWQQSPFGTLVLLFFTILTALLETLKSRKAPSF